jgi:hypothetical protein
MVGKSVNSIELKLVPVVLCLEAKSVTGQVKWQVNGGISRRVVPGLKAQKRQQDDGTDHAEADFER